MWKQLNRVKQRAIWSWEGFVHVYRTEGSLSQWLIVNAVFAVLAIVLPLTGVERAIVLMGGILVLAAECMNTSVERVVDDLSFDKRPLAKQAKDAASAAVALSGVAVGVAWVCILVAVWQRL